LQFSLLLAVSTSCLFITYYITALQMHHIVFTVIEHLHSPQVVAKKLKIQK